MKKIVSAAGLLFCCITSFAGNLSNQIFINIDPSYPGEPPGVYIATVPQASSASVIPNNGAKIYSPGILNVGKIEGGIVSVYNIPPGTQCYPNRNCNWALPAECTQLINTPDQYNGPVIVNGLVSPDLADGITTLTDLNCAYEF
ncbi:MAG: hypothetical protein NTU49_05255 [Gammaproteobacteria bacterium]|nr:hypothetical protein [Gammaproteobacteria bacterium]